MNPSLELARIALREYAEARDREYRMCFYGVSDAECDRIVLASGHAKRVAIDAILDAVPGPTSLGRWGDKYRGNLGLVVGDSLVVLIAPTIDPDEDRPNQHGELYVLPLAAIEGLPVNG